MRRFINSWHNVSLGLAALAGLLAVFAEDIVQQMLLASIAILFLHFFEEFGFRAYSGLRHCRFTISRTSSTADYLLGATLYLRWRGASWCFGFRSVRRCIGTSADLRVTS